MVLLAKIAALRDKRRGGYGNRERNERLTPEVVGGGTTEVEEAYP